MNQREEQFMRLVRGRGISIEPNTQMFRVNGFKYTPDFYLPQLNTYVEVVGTRQAYNLNSKKYKELMDTLAVNFLVCSYDFQPIQAPTFEYITRPIPTCKLTACNRVVYLRGHLGLCYPHTKLFNRKCPVLGSELRRIREIRGLSQAELGKVLGFTQAFVSYCERKNMPLSKRHLIGFFSTDLKFALNKVRKLT